MAFCGVGVEESFRSPAFDGCGELPAEIHGVAETGVEALASERGMDVRGIAGEKDTASAVGRCLTRAVGVAGGDMQRCESYIGAGDSTKNGLQIFEGDLL